MTVIIATIIIVSSFTRGSSVSNSRVKMTPYLSFRSSSSLRLDLGLG